MLKSWKSYSSERPAVGWSDWLDPYSRSLCWYVNTCGDDALNLCRGKLPLAFYSLKWRVSVDSIVPLIDARVVVVDDVNRVDGHKRAMLSEDVLMHEREDSINVCGSDALDCAFDCGMRGCRRLNHPRRRRLLGYYAASERECE
jgi:hypothetical protein